MKTSIVVTSKNDGYGGHLELRAELALQTMIDHYDEVVYVDWCSEGRSLADELTLSGRGNFRHIRVTNDDLAELNPALIGIPMVEVLGRNIGVRRAEGDWIVSSNIDIMPSPLDYQRMVREHLYIVRRRGVDPEVFLTLNKETAFEKLVENRMDYQQPPFIDNGYWAGRHDPWSLIVCVGDFQAASRDLWYKMRGFEESLIYRDYADTNIMKKASIYGLGGQVMDLDVFHLNHSGHGMQKDGISLTNDWEDSVANFDHTKNLEDWGFINYDFAEQII